MTHLRLLVAIQLLLAAHTLQAQTLYTCPGVAVGQIFPADPSVVSECAIGGTNDHLYLSYSAGYFRGTIGASSVTPNPTSSIRIADSINGSDISLQPGSYTGNCTELTFSDTSTTPPPVAATAGEVVCVWWELLDASSATIGNAYLRAKFTGISFTDASMVTNFAVSGLTPASSTSSPSSSGAAAEPVPTLPLLGLLSLSGLISLFGVRKIKKHES